MIDFTTQDSFRRMKSKISTLHAFFCHSFRHYRLRNPLNCMALHVVKERKKRASRRRHELVLMKLTILHHLSTRFSLANGVKKLQCNMIFSAIVAES